MTKQKVYVIQELAPGNDISYYVFTTKDHFEYSAGINRNYSDSLRDSVHKSDLESYREKASSGQPMYGFKEPTLEKTEEDLRRCQSIPVDELYIVGFDEMFISVKEYTEYIKDKNVIEYFEGISC